MYIYSVHVSSLLMGGSGQQQVCPKVVSGNLHAAGHGNQENYQKKSLKGDNLAYVPEKGTKKKHVQLYIPQNPVQLVIHYHSPCYKKASKLWGIWTKAISIQASLDPFPISYAPNSDRHPWACHIYLYKLISIIYTHIYIL